MRVERRTASELGMDGLVEECAILLNECGAQNERSQMTPPDYHFHLPKDGQFWTLSRAGQRVLLKDAKGLTYLAELLRHPDRDIHALDLLALFGGAPPARRGHLPSALRRTSPPTSAALPTICSMRGRATPTSAS